MRHTGAGLPECSPDKREQLEGGEMGKASIHRPKGLTPSRAQRHLLLVLER